MIVKIYRKEEATISPEFYENFEDKLYNTIENIDEVRDVETDYDLIMNKNLIRRYRKDEFFLVIVE